MPPQTGTNDVAGQIANSQTNVSFTGSPAPTSGQIPIATGPSSAVWSDPPWNNGRDPPEAFTTHQRVSLFAVDWTNNAADNDVTITLAGGAGSNNANGILVLGSGGATTASATALGGAILDETYREIYAVADARLQALPTHSGTRVWLLQVGDDQNGLRYGYIGSTRTIAVYYVGSETLYQSFNGDPLTGVSTSVFRRDGTPQPLDPLVLNLYRIRFLDLAGGLAKFDVLSPDGDWVTFHTLSQVNLVDHPLTNGMSFQVGQAVIKSSSDTQQVILTTTHWDAGIYRSQGESSSGGPAPVDGMVRITDDGIDIAPVDPVNGLAVSPKTLPPNAAQETGGNLELIRDKTDLLTVGVDGLYVDNRTLAPNAAKETGGNLAGIRSQTDLLTFDGDRLKVDAALDINGSDIQIGAVEIKDGDTDERATVLGPGISPTVNDPSIVVSISPNTALPNMAVEEALQTTAYDLQAAPYSDTSAIAGHYILDHINFIFTTDESRDILITSFDGQIIYKATDDTSLRIELENLDEGYTGGEDFTIAVSQTAGPCLMSMTASIRTGTAGLAGGPTHVIVDNLVQEEDLPHVTGDKGVMALGVRKDTSDALAGSSGDYQPFIFDRRGKVWVRAATEFQALTYSDKVGYACAHLTNILLTSETPWFYAVNPAGSGVLVRLFEQVVGIGGSTSIRSIIRVYKNPTVTANGTNIGGGGLRNGQATKKLEIFVTPTVTANGTLVQVYSVNTNSVQRMLDLCRYIENGDSILITAQSSSTSTDHTFSMAWAEVPP